MGRARKYATKEEAAEANRQRANLYNQIHKEEKKAYARQYYEKNREYLIQKARERYARSRLNTVTVVSTTGTVIEILPSDQ